MLHADRLDDQQHPASEFFSNTLISTTILSVPSDEHYFSSIETSTRKHLVPSPCVCTSMPAYLLMHATRRREKKASKHYGQGKTTDEQNITVQQKSRTEAPGTNHPFVPSPPPAHNNLVSMRS